MLWYLWVLSGGTWLRNQACFTLRCPVYFKLQCNNVCSSCIGSANVASVTDVIRVCLSVEALNQSIVVSMDSIQNVIEAMFTKIDADQSGSITQTEMDAVFKVFDADGKVAIKVNRQGRVGSLTPPPPPLVPIAASVLAY